METKETISLNALIRAHAHISVNYLPDHAKKLGKRQNVTEIDIR